MGIGTCILTKKTFSGILLCWSSYAAIAAPSISERAGKQHQAAASYRYDSKSHMILASKIANLFVDDMAECLATPQCDAMAECWN